ncbi:MAG: N-acetylmuramoyl-L-alanine amidase [Spirochaetia bacterium]|nr:N-acetylmuramoyl-L-alanine amidase [Spirochaetia bacterium]
MQVKNLIRQLPWHPDGVWGERKIHEINKIVVHQTQANSTFETINRYHISPGVNNHISQRGCPHICYHFGIREDGEVIQANDLEHVVWHTKSENRYGVSIAHHGNFKGLGHEIGDDPTKVYLLLKESL